MQDSKVLIKQTLKPIIGVVHQPSPGNVSDFLKSLNERITDAELQMNNYSEVAGKIVYKYLEEKFMKDVLGQLENPSTSQEEHKHKDFEVLPKELFEQKFDMGIMVGDVKSKV